ncbi:MAG TPA: protein kinase, partial [Pyrinomonadaceae bacterium]|nr:protein kinase [Pyrinomonadaceae bacterium]
MNTGDWLGRYKIVRKIGEGGMGEVFLAEDPKLNRQIAVKILSADFASDSDRMMRFVHEAISASALNHPNIITIYEINDDNDIPFIAMEFVEGETLGRRMKASPLAVHETLDVAIQIATALAAAHEASVVHRDIKPDNMILRPDGLVKVLDFGLAKQVERTSGADFEARTMHNVHTHPGLVMGTVAYMSPEQARGKLVDARSDIFSFGSMLYQMVSGRLPFIGENDVDVVGSILHKEPRPLSQSARPIPHDVELLIKKSLRKNRDERYQTMRELLADLKEIREELRLDSKHGNGNGNGNSGSRMDDLERGMPTERMNAADVNSTSELSMAPRTLSGILMNGIKAHPVKSLGYSVLLSVALAGALYGAYRFADSLRQPEAFQTMRFEKLTYSGNVVSGQAAVSPDGKYFAYVVQNGGEQSLWVKQTTTQSNLQIVQPSGAKFSGLSFSPDSDVVYFGSVEKDNSESIFQVPALGGNSRKLIADGKGPIAFSPDNKRFAFVRGGTLLMTANNDGSDQRLIAKASDGKQWIRTAWSPDGTRIAAAVFSADDSNDHLVEINVADGTEQAVASPGWLRLRGLAWLPNGNGMAVNGRDLDTQLAQLWIVEYPTGARHRITNDLSVYQGLSITANGRTLVSTQQNTLSNLWVKPEGAEQAAAKITSEVGKADGLSGLAWTPTGKVVYTVRTSGTEDLWIINRDGTDNRQLTFNSRSNWSPDVSADGRYIVFVSSRNGNLNIWRTGIDGGNALQLTKDAGTDAEPSISPDG